MPETISLTFSDQGENHVGMELVGSMVPRGLGFQKRDLLQIQDKFNSNGYTTELHYLNDLYRDVNIKKIIPEAYVMVIRGGLHYFLDFEGKTLSNLYEELTSFNWDDKYYDTRRSKVLTKRARHNVCMGEIGQESDYENKKGTVIAYETIPILDSIRKNLSQVLGPKGENLICEGNRYYDLKKCGIGWHGDKERRKVVAFRLGESMNLNYQWFYQHKSLGKILELNLQGGDMYIMTEKAVGTDWGLSSKYTLRHAAGLPTSKYLQPK